MAFVKEEMLHNVFDNVRKDIWGHNKVETNLINAIQSKFMNLESYSGQFSIHYDSRVAYLHTYVSI